MFQQLNDKNKYKKEKEEHEETKHVNELESPFNLFLRIPDLIDDEKRYIYFLAYSIGKKRVVLWGVYDKRKKEIIIDNACKYAVKNLMGILRQWKFNEYEYTANAVKNQIIKRIRLYLSEMLEDPLPDIKTYEDYEFFKDKVERAEFYNDYDEELLAYFEDKFNVTESNHDYFKKLDEFLGDLLMQIDKYEKELNLKTTDQKLLNKMDKEVRELIEEVVNKFFKELERSKFASKNIMDVISDCPSLDECMSSVFGDDFCAVYFYGDRYFYEDDFSELVLV